jgi:hypothetical protein
MTSSATYEKFLTSRTQWNSGDGFEPIELPPFLFPFQRDLTEWALRMGRAGIFADCGLGKTPMQLVWADNVYRHTGRPVLVVTPLAVSFQTETEARKFGYDAGISRDGRVAAPITVTNYERLEHFDTDMFGGVVCDESSAIKAFDGKRRALVTEFLRTRQYRLLCTATAAPNDYIELGTSSEALGYLGHMDMLTRFFTNRHKTSAPMGGRWGRQAQPWRLKGHADDGFWQWVASWARAIRRPSDLGYDDTGFTLPELVEQVHEVQVAADPDTGQSGLFEVPATGLREERAEARRSIQERCEKAAELVADADSAVAWCQLNDEGRLLARLINGAVEVAGSDTPDQKEEKLAAFSRGEIRVLVTKPTIGGWGLNWQHCHRMTFFPNHSYEQYYQAVRRSWRFGQTAPVTVDVVSTTGGSQILANLRRKATQADEMFSALTAHMRSAIETPDEMYTEKIEVPRWVS